MFGFEVGVAVGMWLFGVFEVFVDEWFFGFDVV